MTPVSHADAVADDPPKDRPVEERPFSYLPPGTLEKMKSQEASKRAATKILDVLVELVGNVRNPRGSGFAGLWIDDHGVQVRWKGTLPGGIEDAVTRARADTPVNVAQSAYSRAELTAEADKLRTQMFQNPEGPIHRLEIKGDGSGIVAVTEKPRDKAELRAAYSSLSDIQVPLTIVQKARATTAGRLDDTNPFYAGALMWNGGYDNRQIYCTAGWPVQGRSNGNWYLVTASHCAYSGQHWWNGNGSAYIGQAGLESTFLDIILVGMAGPENYKYIWDGGVPGGENTSPEYVKPVAGWGHVIPGEWLCASGSYSGAVCRWVVNNDFPYSYCDHDKFGTWECYGDMFTMTQIDGLRGCRGGDSGGPVFALSNDLSQVIARGVMSGCNISGDGDWMIFQDFYSIYTSLHVTV
ncbi:hypothetical protein Aple_040920 [Acrocarpospora pleiomorpha]|uniref:Peptidase S1 domain-containing protein n=1 Tax=Acrocarpospora pleiomorpha TaxID=90975 RepID=A0A5M3XKB5_9ACTN|nr:hypothetical protein [Acrocarpospora pleiomorpha]GES21196.1 hypothetical protein Aple_040920 [Acrocarpospora pleiomorpha]